MTATEQIRTVCRKAIREAPEGEKLSLLLDLLLEVAQEVRLRQQPDACPSAMPQPPLITAKDAAKLLGVTKSQVYALASSGELASVRINAQLRFDPDKIREFRDQGGTPSNGS